MSRTAPSARSFIEQLSTEHPPLWIFYGLMLVMAVYNLFVYVSVRETAYLYYVCYIVSYIGLQFSLNGFAFEYLWPEQVWWNSKPVLFVTAYGGAYKQQELFDAGADHVLVKPVDFTKLWTSPTCT